MKEDPIRLVLGIFSFFKRERKKITIIFTSSSLEVLLHLIQTCSHGDPHRTFKVNPIAARRCLGVRVCSSVCDCEQSKQRAGDERCARARGRSARGGGALGVAHSRAQRPLGGGRGGGRKRRRRRRKWPLAAGRIKSNQTRPENCVQEGSDRRRMGKGEPLTAFETSRKKGGGREGVVVEGYWEGRRGWQGKRSTRASVPSSTNDGVPLAFFSPPLFYFVLAFAFALRCLSFPFLPPSQSQTVDSSRAGEIISFTLAKGGRD